MDSQSLRDMYDKSQVLHKLAETVAPISATAHQAESERKPFLGGLGSLAV